MKVKDLPGRPPLWGCFCAAGERCASGEVGILKNVIWSDETGLLNLFIDYDGEEHSGMLELDRALGGKVLQGLMPGIGRAISEIADLEPPIDGHL